MVLPLSYYHCLQSLLYELMCPSLANEVHEEKEAKPFVFSSLFGEYLLDSENKTILFSDQVSLYIASRDSYLLLSILSRIVSKPSSFALLGQKIVFLKAIALKNEVEEKESYLVETLSPLVLHETIEKEGKKWTHYFSPMDPSFQNAANKNFLRKASFLKAKVSSDPFFLLPGENVREVVALYKGFVIKGYVGTFRFLGKKDQLLFLLDQGVGERNSEGFGMIQIKKERKTNEND